MLRYIAAIFNGELTSAAVLLREPPGFYEKPRYSRRLVKRLVRFSIIQNSFGIHFSNDYGVLLKLCILRYFCLGNLWGHPKRYL